MDNVSARRRKPRPRRARYPGEKKLGHSCRDYAIHVVAARPNDIRELRISSLLRTRELKIFSSSANKAGALCISIVSCLRWSAISRSTVCVRRRDDSIIHVIVYNLRIAESAIVCRSKVRFGGTQKPALETSVPEQEATAVCPCAKLISSGIPAIEQRIAALSRRTIEFVILRMRFE
jgi:hypothetical protein